MQKENKKFIKGVSFLNPVEVDGEYYNFVAYYALKNGYNHIELIGPTHDGVKGNIDGMVYLKKYSKFNGVKDKNYVNYCLKCVNEATKKVAEAGAKSYFWHHELDLPNGFKEEYPETLNDFGDIEVTHPIVKDYLENRIYDFFESYPYMHGITLTLHETKVPLLKLKNQKLNKVERVKYVTEILYNACKKLGKELIVRPFASLEEDYVMMTKAYEEISSNLIIMDKWTQFDWSLTAPHNRFYSKIKNNPLLVETDIFGEFFGKGRLPLMLKNHILEKYKYCQSFNPVGYVSRIDRNGSTPFGEVNEVNLVIMTAVLNGLNVDSEIDNFFHEKYGKNYLKVREIMEDTEEILKKIIYLQGYYFSELSMFPSLNHSKNHFYFEFMKENYCLASNEWFIPTNWKRGDISEVLLEKQQAVTLSTNAFEKLKALKDDIPSGEYSKLYVKFANLYYVALAWAELTNVYLNYAKYFESGAKDYETSLFIALKNLSNINEKGYSELKNDFYLTTSDGGHGKPSFAYLIENFIKEVSESFEIEKATVNKLNAENLTDYVICGGANEGHKLQKEVNFSDTLVIDNELCRIPGNKNGTKWSTINAHGWFSYEVKLKSGLENHIEITLGSCANQLDVKITVGNFEKVINATLNGKTTITIPYTAMADENAVRIRFDRISGNTPCVYLIKIK